MDLRLASKLSGGQKYNFLNPPENEHILQPLVADQIASVCEGSGVRHEDDTLGEAEADAVDVGSLLRRFIRNLELLLVRVHKVFLLAEAGDGPDVRESLAGNLGSRCRVHMEGSVTWEDR